MPLENNWYLEKPQVPNEQARYTAQVDNTIQTFELYLKKSGPAKSTPVISKATVSETRSSGSGQDSVVNGFV
ncbi:hypothetical protein TNIN_142701 [Trichonephila inaurata madagascariensis]|uniref:Uncharacterized protein n=1 Tax=Trichonephila inaurata madagascariensis TaxID=2747483 RepID=A0A8X6JZ31_9ARAC|nr:hypothetical protein TNIN_142701 [Trichonephila inaurata madagascariensis]